MIQVAISSTSELKTKLGNVVVISLYSWHEQMVILIVQVGREGERKIHKLCHKHLYRIINGHRSTLNKEGSWSLTKMDFYRQSSSIQTCLSSHHYSHQLPKKSGQQKCKINISRLKSNAHNHTSEHIPCDFTVCGCHSA